MTDELEPTFEEDVAAELSVEPESTEPEPEPTPEPEPEPEEPVPAADFVEFDGQQVPTEQFRATKRFMDWAAANPEAWDKLVAWESGKLEFVPKEEEPQTFIDDEDEFDEFSDPEVVKLRSKIQQLEAKINEVGQVTGWREEVSRRETMEAGIQAFHAEHSSIAEDDWKELFTTAKDHELIRIYVARDPYNPVEAVKRALETAYRIKFYDRAHDNGASTVVKDIAAKRKAQAASSTRQAAPRQAPQPEAGTRDAMVNDLREILQAAE